MEFIKKQQKIRTGGGQSIFSIEDIQENSIQIKLRSGELHNVVKINVLNRIQNNNWSNNNNLDPYEIGIAKFILMRDCVKKWQHESNNQHWQPFLECLESDKISDKEYKFILDNSGDNFRRHSDSHFDPVRLCINRVHDEETAVLDKNKSQELDENFFNRQDRFNFKLFLERISQYPVSDNFLDDVIALNDETKRTKDFNKNASASIYKQALQIIKISQKIRNSKMKNENFLYVKWFQALSDKFSDENYQTLGEKINQIDWHGSSESIVKFKAYDPFSFIYFLASKNTTNYKVIFQEVAHAFEITEPLPSIKSGDSWVFPTPQTRSNVLYCDGHKQHESDLLWQFFKQITLITTIDQLQESEADLQENFAQVLSLTNIGIPKLTQTLFLINAEIFFPIDFKIKPISRDLLENPTKDNEINIKNIEKQINNKGFKEYIATLNKIYALFPNKKPYEINYFLYENDKKVPEPLTGENIMKSPLNQILYGPPGTGKTYSTVSKALEILEATDEQKESIKSIGQLKEEFGSQVEFITFHQSFSYEDFVEGLKAESDDNGISYDVKSGVFKRMCNNAKENLEALQNTTENKIDIKLLLNDFANYIDSEKLRDEKILLAKQSDGFWGDTYFGEILRKPDETFKSFKTTGSVASQNLTEKIIVRDYQQFYDGDIKGYKDIKPAQNSKATYHGNALYYYQLFTRIKEFQDGNFEQGASYFIESKNIKKPHILIIDEINRGNISRIFGELITLIEPSKRIGATGEQKENGIGSEPLTVKLPYSKDEGGAFGVPSNLYIIGTMNTADRSLALMDTALRRRFDFVEMMPTIKDKEGNDLISDNADGVNLQELLETINQRIEFLYDREHTIGHSFLMNVDSLPALKNAFKNKILPLLEEYFYDDWNKIKLILNDKNDSFYIKVKYPDNLFFDTENINTDRIIYNRNDIDGLDKAAFTHIYDNQHLQSQDEQ